MNCDIQSQRPQRSKRLMAHLIQLCTIHVRYARHRRYPILKSTVTVRFRHTMKNQAMTMFQWKMKQQIATARMLIFCWYPRSLTILYHFLYPQLTKYLAYRVGRSQLPRSPMSPLKNQHQRHRNGCFRQGDLPVVRQHPGSVQRARDISTIRLICCVIRATIVMVVGQLQPRNVIAGTARSAPCTSTAPINLLRISAITLPISACCVTCVLS